MQHNPLQNRRRQLGGRADRRGSAIVLVLVSVVLMAVLAATLLQVTRFERIPRPESNIDIVVESVVDEILSQATNDLLDDQGNMFNTRLTATNLGGDEPWDFPYTNPGNFGRQAEGINGNTINVIGGAMDDPWLASSTPDFRATVPANSVNNPARIDTNFGVWRKITSLTGLYVGGTGGDADLSTRTEPIEYPVTIPNIEIRSDSNQRINGNITLVDADGDGIGDSRWEWAPLRQIGTTRYVMAVRIVDLSARVDLNVATGQFDGTSLGAGLPRGDGPTELDGSGFAELMAFNTGSGVSPAQARNDWRRVLGFRLTGNPGTSIGATPGYLPYDGNNAPPAAGTRRDYWERGASRVSPFFQRNGVAGPGLVDYSATSTFGLADAFELLQRNGLNSDNFTTAERLMPNLLRHPNTPGTFNEDNFVTTPTVTANNWSQRQFWELDPRKYLSPYTGSMAVARPLQFDEPREPKLDVNEAVQTVAGRSELRDTILEVLRLGPNAPALIARYPHLADVAGVSNQLAANIADYIDEDNFITTVNNRTGFEALPYITEVYTQRLYNLLNVTPPVPPATNDNALWTAAGEQGYAIEIGNPFGKNIGGTWYGRPVRLDGVWIKIDSNTEVELGSVAGVPNLLQPGEVLILRHDSAGNTTNPNLDDISNLYTAGMTVQEVDVSGDARFNIPGNQRNIRIELRAEMQTAPGAAASWAYSACDVQVPTQGISEQVPPGTFTPPFNTYQGYVQTNYQGVGNGLRMMTVTAEPRSVNNRGFGDETSTLNSPSANCDTTGGGNAELNITPALADESKPLEPTTFASLGQNDQQIVWHDNPRERMHWVGDILQIPLIGPDRLGGGNDELMADAFFEAAGSTDNLTGGITSLLLPYKTVAGTPAFELAPVVNPDTSTAPGGSFGMYNLPHALLLLERLTTYNPATDGEDGDDEADTESLLNPDEDELLVAGKINLNTATFETLTRVLPFPDLPTRQAIAAGIIDRRESLQQRTDHSVGVDNLPGIAYTSVLYENMERLAYAGNVARDGAQNTDLAGTRIDWNDFESTVGTFPAALTDGVADDREEEIMLTKWLAEVADVRSDVFAAYIVVQGYPANDFTAGAIESARLIVIFSRANVRQAGDRAVEIGRFRIQ